MQNPTSLSAKHFLLPALLMGALSWAGLAALVIFTLPTVWMRWLFFVCWTMGLISLALPVAYFIHRRFPKQPQAAPQVILRQATWVGVYGAVLAWLQLGRVNSLWIIVGLAAGLIAIEYLIRMRECSIWRPPPLPEADQPEKAGMHD